MAEPTQRYTPVQVDTSPPSVGAVPALRVDKTLDIISKYAQDLNTNNITAARQQLYVEGKSRAAQGESIKQMREQQSPINTLFGGGASLSGAMDYREQEKIQQYKTGMIKSMEELRKLRPEEFVSSQTDEIKKYYTNDDITNARIMASFNDAMPQMAALHAKQHDGYIQETMLNSLTSSATNSIEAYTAALATGDEDTIIAAQGDILVSTLKPDGMNLDAYKKFMYGMAEHEAGFGVDIVSDTIRASGLINNEADVKKLDGYNATRQGARYAMKANEFTDVYDQGLAAAPEMTRDEISQLIVQMTEQYGSKLATPARMGALYKAKLTGIKNKLAKDAIGFNVNALYNGLAYDIPTGKLQEAMQVGYEIAVKDPTKMPKYLQALVHTAVPNNSLKAKWSSGLSLAIKADTDGSYLLTPAAQDAITQVDALWKIDQSTAVNHLDSDAAGLYEAYRTIREADPDNSEVVWLQRAQEAMKVPGNTHQKQDKAISAQVLDDLGVDDDIVNVAAQANIIAAASTLNAAYGNTAVATGKLKQWVAGMYEEINGQLFTKIDGKSLQERSGTDDAVGAALGKYKVTQKYTGTPVVTMSASTNSLTVMGVDGSNAVTYPFEELRGWQNQGKNPSKKITEEHDKNLEEYKAKAKPAVLKAMMQERADLPPGYGAGQRFDKTAPTVEFMVDSMSTTQILNKYKQILAEEGEKGSILEQAASWITNIFGSTPGVADDPRTAEVMQTAVDGNRELEQAELDAANTGVTQAGKTDSDHHWYETQIPPLDAIDVPDTVMNTITDGDTVYFSAGTDAHEYAQEALVAATQDPLVRRIADNTIQQEAYIAGEYPDTNEDYPDGKSFGLGFFLNDMRPEVRKYVEQFKEEHGNSGVYISLPDAIKLTAEINSNDVKRLKAMYPDVSNDEAAVLVDITYNGGDGTFKEKFPTMFGYRDKFLNTANPEERRHYKILMAYEMKKGVHQPNSTWYNKSTARVTRNMELLTGLTVAEIDAYGAKY